MKNVCVVGTGYVGLVTGACLAELGNRVWCIDIDESKVESLNKGVIPIFEPGLEPMVRENMEAGRLTVTTSYAEGLKEADFVFVAVGTPNTEEGVINLNYLSSAYEMIGANLNGKRPIIVNKSTVPPGTCEMMESRLSRMVNGKGPVHVVSNPEFLREGYAVQDFMHPSRIVIGSSNGQAAEAVAELNRPLDCPIVFTDTRSAEMIKYASNAFLAMKISFINEIAEICDGVGVDVVGVAQGIGLDPRIGRSFLNAGIGYGGSCLPKDVAVLRNVAAECGFEPAMLNAAAEVNLRQPRRLVEQVSNALGGLEGARIAVLGLTFKPNTDDLRHSAALKILTALLDGGAEVRACDPQAFRNLKALPCKAEYVMDPYQAAEGCDAVILATEWDEYKNIELGRLKAVMRGSVLADGRNVIDPQKAAERGFVYIGMGRGNRASVLP
ncbi:MAG: UDP-glucose/GDP-mannose dehydrogenase family protein [Chloroflexi bacterium]|nr:UDP-glucose/GDP-mannose dehydrogenase family protein [Chloroflexota bacterium]